MFVRLFGLARCWLACLWLGGLLAGCGAGGHALPAGFIKSQAWWMDSGGQADLAVAQGAAWEAYAGWKSFGFGPEPVWFKLRLRAADPGDEGPWILRVRPAFLDKLDLYDPAAGLVLRNGDYWPPHDDALQAIHFTFQLPALPHERDVYLRLETTSTRTLALDVLPLAHAQRLIRWQEWALGFVTSASAVFALWALAQWWRLREGVMGRFALKQLVATVWTFLILGFGRIVFGEGWPPGWLTAATSFMLPLLLATTLWFYLALLEPYRPARWAMRACLGLMVLALGLLVLQPLGMTRQSIALTNALVPVMFVLVIATTLTARQVPQAQTIPRGYLLTYLCLYGLLNAVPVAIILGWLPEQALLFTAGLFHVVMDGVVVFMMLQYRARALARQQQQTERELVRSQEQALAEKRQRQEQEQLFAMLAHELKTPLATLRMRLATGAIDPGQVERTIADLNQVVDRCVHAGQLTDQGLQPHWQAVDAAELTAMVIASSRVPRQIDFYRPEGECVLVTDAQILSVVLGNLLDNACKYGAPEGRVLVRLDQARRDDTPGWQWSVINKPGPAGWPEVDRLFEKYHRGPHARRQSGSGLGLFLVKGLLALLGGRVWYQPLEERIVFCVWLPGQHPGPATKGA